MITQEHIYDAETKEETWSQILFAAAGQNDPLSCYEVGKMGCTKITGKFWGKDSGGLETYSYIVHFSDGTQREIVDDTFAVS